MNLHRFLKWALIAYIGQALLGLVVGLILGLTYGPEILEWMK